MILKTKNSSNGCTYDVDHSFVELEFRVTEFEWLQFSLFFLSLSLLIMLMGLLLALLLMVIGAGLFH
jgi:hypothetical protein